MEFKELAAAQQAAKQGNAEAQCCLGAQPSPHMSEAWRGF